MSHWHALAFTLTHQHRLMHFVMFFKKEKHVFFFLGVGGGGSSLLNININSERERESISTA